MEKKRIISFVLGIVLLIPFFMNFIPSVQATSKEGYYSVIEDYALDCAFSSLEEADQQKCKGLLFDINGDGQDELIVQYLDRRSVAYSIWSMDGHTPVCVLDAPYYTGIEVIMYATEYNSKPYFILSSWVGGSDGSYFEWLFYDATSTPYQLAYNLGEASDYESSASSKSISNLSDDGSTYDQVYLSIESGVEIPFESAALTFDVLVDYLKQEDVAKEEHPYIPIIRETIECTQSVYQWEDGYGTLYDVDNNGIEELLMVYTANASYNDSYFGPAKVFSVFTIVGNKAVPIIEQEMLYFEVGGPSGYIAIVEKEGERFIASTAENGEVGPISYRGGKWKLLSIDGSVSNIHTDISYTEVYSYEEDKIIYDESQAIIDGTVYGYQVLEEWVDSLDILVRIDPYELELDENVATLQELLDYIRTLPSASECFEDSVELKAYTAFPESTIGTDQEVKIMFSLYVNGERMPIEEYALEISNPSAIETTKTTDSDGSRIITFKGKAPGSSDLTFTENSTGISTTITVAVEDQCNYFRCSAFPTPYESIGSIYVADYSCKVNENGKHDITFNAYNTSYAYGVVEVYDGNGSLVKLISLDPRSDGSGMEKVVNGFKWVWEDIKDLFDGDTPFYTKDSNAKHTPVKLENVPENAEIIISSDGNASDFAALYTGVDVFVRTVCNAASIDLKMDGQAASVNELMNALADSLIKSISHEEIENTIHGELIKEAAESISTSIAIASSADSISDIYETVYNLFQNLDIDAESIMLNVLKGMGYGVADTAFTTVVPAYKIVNFVDQILETAWPLLDYQFNLDTGKMEIHVSKHGLQNFVVNNGVTVTQKNNFGDSTVLDTYEVVEDDELSDLSDSIPAELRNYTIYNITLREDGAQTQPNSEIEVRLPVPNNIEAERCVVYRLEENGTCTQMQSSVDDGYITFKTTHLSYYVIGQLSDAVALTVEDGLQPNYWGIIGVGALVLVSITFVVMLTKRKKTGK